MERLSRRERERLRHRREILDAALELFSERGYHNVSVRDIAQKAEFSIGTIYKFFEGKEDLYRSLMLDKAEELHAQLIEALRREGDEVEKLRRFITTKCRLFRENVKIVRLYFTETRGAGFSIKAGLDQEIRKKYDECLKLVASIFRSGMEKKIFNDLSDPYRLAVALDSVCNGFIFLWLEKPEEHPLPEDPNLILDIFFKPLLLQSS
ncbi:TetR/AcrR family transcriptional regulator [Thermodesulforhabdus norvegica]|uniref:Transcriptional regulator, TetR family n=1 Tax=Thermodesulforhabdus norvegica TaxID=39841 RepID=A0A1I4T627_9BACT|nr:TetR/AcrR family transcriptional regulator [Thermodesulforhabdus norvegica]SFM72095.1 transcriptional regulator, TetR family [Thermodesulforhabdus norvegica]